MDKRSFLKQQEGSGLLVPTILHSVSLADELSEERLKESYEFHIPKESPGLPQPALEDTSTRDGTPGGPPDLNSLEAWAIWPQRSLSSKGWEPTDIK